MYPRFTIKNNFIKTSQFSGTASSGYVDWALGRSQGKHGKSPYGFDYDRDFQTQLSEQAFFNPNTSSSNPYIPPSADKLDQLKKDEAEALENLPEYKDLSKTILTQRLFDFNKYAIQVELNRLKKISPEQTEILDWDKKKVKIKDFIDKLNKKIKSINDMAIYTGEYADFLNSDVFAGLGASFGLNPSEEATQWQGPRDLASLERLIRARQENIEDIDAYIFDLVTGGEFTPFSSNIAHTNAKFVKTAKDDLVKEADEEIENYYNNLYQDSEGSPDYGTALEHPEETKNELSTKIHHHRFRKK